MFFKRKQRFSIRKFTIGTCSVLLGTVFVAGVDQVAAEVTPSEVVAPSAEQGGEPSAETTSPVTEPVVEAQPVASEAPAVAEAPKVVERTFAVHTKVKVLDAANLSDAEKSR
ncbi:YSIRK-type signal peptide-containing protein [Streptococcus marmotae]|uniref:YSIRK-type signal peptide-containing protein n=1 Tax=Streptococcus marmotae TaxID=1825069 RepID=UPI00082F9480|nr:YSIRK-type signal peptide-containing protein [Streptococcus marmotae]